MNFSVGPFLNRTTEAESDSETAGYNYSWTMDKIQKDYVYVIFIKSTQNWNRNSRSYWDLYVKVYCTEMGLVC